MREPKIRPGREVRGAPIGVMERARESRRLRKMAFEAMVNAEELRQAIQARLDEMNKPKPEVQKRHWWRK